MTLHEGGDIPLPELTFLLPCAQEISCKLVDEIVDFEDRKRLEREIYSKLWWQEKFLRDDGVVKENRE